MLEGEKLRLLSIYCLNSNFKIALNLFFKELYFFKYKSLFNMVFLLLLFFFSKKKSKNKKTKKKKPLSKKDKSFFAFNY